MTNEKKIVNLFFLNMLNNFVEKIKINFSSTYFLYICFWSLILSICSRSLYTFISKLLF